MEIMTTTLSTTRSTPHVASWSATIYNDAERGGGTERAAPLIPSERVSLFFQAEDGIRDYKVTGVQTCALPISAQHVRDARRGFLRAHHSQAHAGGEDRIEEGRGIAHQEIPRPREGLAAIAEVGGEIGRASCRERV